MREELPSSVVGMSEMTSARMPIESLADALRSAHPELERVAAAAAGPVYVVGGAVRDQLLGRGRADLDLVVVGDAGALARALGATEVVEHERFATAKVEMAGHEVDIATARTETYSWPGALPDVSPAAEIEADLARRDFTINAMAIPVGGEPRLLDPFGGREDLERGQLRVLHPASFLDDPTRAIRAARYASRFGFGLEPETERLIRETDPAAVSGDRRQAELSRLAGEAAAPRGFELLAEWGLVEPRERGIELAAAVDQLLGSEPWRSEVGRSEALLAAALGPEGEEVALAGTQPQRPSEGVELARGRSSVELVLARALGAEWLDSYLEDWRRVALEIDGSDLLAAGVPQGPALGKALAAALRAKRDGEISTRAEELTTALAAAQPK
jgi:tRNA nucleotidyltransferase (CCA-adding enzyme)